MYLSELIQRARTPVAILLDGHNLNNAHRMRDAASFEGAGRLFCRVLENLREVCIRERAIGLTLHATKGPSVRGSWLHRQELFDLVFILLDGDLWQSNG